MLRLNIALVLGVLAALTAHADVTLPAIFSDHMVLQRDKPVAVCGRAEPGETVYVEFAGKSAESRADAKGEWRVVLKSLRADRVGRELTVRGKNRLVLRDVLVGEVWLCSGQSNMEKSFGARKGQKPTDNSAEELAAAKHPEIRFFQVPHYGQPKEGGEPLQWVPCSPESLEATEFSAVAYFFGRELHRALDVPIGLIHSSFGGTQIETWMPAEAFDQHPSLQPLKSQTYKAWVKGVQPMDLYYCMIQPFVPFSLRGFLWYQGEANCMNGDTGIYTEKMAALITAWRNAWSAPDAPFYFAQIAPFNYSEFKGFSSKLTPDTLPAFWEAQIAATRVPKTGIISTQDLAGNAKDIHPTNKHDVGLRFARLALADTYRKETSEAHSPMIAGVRPDKKGRLRLEIRFTGNGLRTRDGLPPTQFKIAGENRVFRPAHAELKGDRVLVWSTEVPHPVAVRFCWGETSVSNVVNSSDLPLLPYRSDTWPVETIRP